MGGRRRSLKSLCFARAKCRPRPTGDVNGRRDGPSRRGARPSPQFPTAHLPLVLVALRPLPFVRYLDSPPSFSPVVSYPPPWCSSSRSRSITRASAKLFVLPSGRPCRTLVHHLALKADDPLPLATGTSRSFLRHEWSRVILGMWQKYPNPATSHVISVDTIDRTVDPVTGIIRSSVLSLIAPRAVRTRLWTERERVFRLTARSASQSCLPPENAL